MLSPWQRLFPAWGSPNEFHALNTWVLWAHGGSDGKESACRAGDPGLIPGSGGSPGEGNDNPLQYSCLENSMDREACWLTVLVLGVVNGGDTTERLSRSKHDS